MDPLTISFDTKVPPGYKVPYSYPPKVSITDHKYVLTPVPVVLEDPQIKIASVLAHEVRNPLTNINLSIEMLRSIITDGDQQTYLDIIMRSSTRINDLINELLKYQQADEVLAEDHSIRSLLNEVLEMAKDRIRLKNIRVKKDYCVQDGKIILHRPKMKIALTNIIINAIDAMESHGGELRLATKSIDNKYLVQIEDNGCGMSQINLKKMFKPFFTNKPNGVGLGLATTYDILRANRVGIHVKSVEHEGTRFTLAFEKRTQH
ncbi:MAG: ATP-binding protein [Chitinophagaceae bacterium]